MEEVTLLDQLQEEYKKNPTKDLRNQIIAELKNEYGEVFDLDNPPTQEHKWVDRGGLISCEGAGHPNHRHFKRR